MSDDVLDPVPVPAPVMPDIDPAPEPEFDADWVGVPGSLPESLPSPDLPFIDEVETAPLALDTSDRAERLAHLDEWVGVDLCGGDYLYLRHPGGHTFKTVLAGIDCEHVATDPDGIWLYRAQ